MADRALETTGLGPALDRLYTSFNYADSATDPIQIVRRFDRADDREVVAFCAAALAFGRVTSVLQSIERVLAVMGRQPGASTCARSTPRARPASSNRSSIDGSVARTSWRLSG